MFVLYEVALYLVFVVTLPFFLLLGAMRGKYLTNFRERFGLYRTGAEPHDLWIHAVSVGETLAARPIVDEILRSRPGISIVFTTTTLTGQAQARRLYPGATVTYFPFDFTLSVRRFLDHHRPRLFVTLETEIWPNVTRLAAARGVRMLLANGRLSDRSYPRYRMFRPLLAPILARYAKILAREETDRERFVAIGAPASIVEVVGNVKFDYEPDDTPLEIAPALDALIAGRRVLVLGSTVEGEDEMLLEGVQALIAEQNAFVIIAPRKPERFEHVAALLATTSIRFVRRSQLDAAGATPPAAEVLIVDTFGELARMYRYATVAFIGGSLVPHGGHNPIEAAAAGVPVCFGPSMSNFREIAAVFVEHEAAREVATASEVLGFARTMFEDEELRRAWGERGRTTVAANRGASARTAERIAGLLP